MSKTLLAVLALAASFSVGAQGYPNKPIRWVVPYPGGGITDVVTRVVTQKMSGPLGQSIVVDNKPGANSIIGSDIVAKAAPDGYTVLTVIAGYAANVTLYQGKLPFDPKKDLVPVSLAGIAPLIMTANNTLPAKDVKELIAYAKANPGKLNFGTPGNGTAPHLAMKLLEEAAGISVQGVHYKGNGPALNDLLGGQIHLLFDGLQQPQPFVNNGKLKLLAVASLKRMPGAHDVPTIGET